MSLYIKVAQEIVGQIEQGLYKTGERLPGVRQLSLQFKVSISTIVRAHQVLEDQQVIEAKSRSGFYVSTFIQDKPKAPAISKPSAKPVLVKGQVLALNLIKATSRPHILQLGAAVPHHDFLPMKAIQRSIAKMSRQYLPDTANYEFPPGNLQLRQQIAKRMYLAGHVCKADEIIITNGCQESLSLALRTIAKPGGIVAIESPAYYGLLQVIEAMGMQALEIPTDPQRGISLSALELAIDKWKLKAVAINSNFSNPLGYCMSNDRKKRLVKLLAKHNIVLIEDDVYGDLGFDQSRPCALKAYDKSDNVIYCSSYSKTLSPGLRVGWIIPGDKYFQKIEYQKYVFNLAAATLSQLVVADFLEHGGYERYLRHVRDRYKNQVARVTQAIVRYFPEGTKVTRPKGGFVLWIEFPVNVDVMKLHQAALEKNISIAPGIMFSSTQKYRNFIRISCAQPWNDKLDNGLLTLGRMACSI